MGQNIQTDIVPRAGRPPEDETAPLNPKQERFVQEYLVDLDPKAAYRVAYPDASEATTKVNCYALLRVPKIRRAIREAQVEQMKRTHVTQDWVIRKLVENVKKAMQEVEVTDKNGKRLGIFKYEGAVANQALKMLGNHLGMFVDRREVSGRVEVALSPEARRSRILALLAKPELPPDEPPAEPDVEIVSEDEPTA